MRRVWTSVGTVLLVMLMLGAPATLAKPGRGGSGATCPTGSADVVLDPGHGGDDTGATNGDLLEKNLTLDIANQTAAILENQYGLTVALTRYDDSDPGNSERGEIANACGAAAFVEIHLNGSSDPSVDYTQTFWGKKRKDLDFATWMDGAMGNLRGEDGGPIANNGVGQFANGGLLAATMPSTLVEAVFLTNTWEGEQFQAGTRQGEIAQALAAGIGSWLSQ